MTYRSRKLSLYAFFFFLPKIFEMFDLHEVLRNSIYSLAEEIGMLASRPKETGLLASKGVGRLQNGVPVKQKLTPWFRRE
jgi:hypothetical protein